MSWNKCIHRTSSQILLHVWLRIGGCHSSESAGLCETGSHVFFTSFTAQLYCTPTICECLEPWFMQSWVTLAQKKTIFIDIKVFMVNCNINNAQEHYWFVNIVLPRGVVGTTLLYWRRGLCPSFGLRLGRLHEQRPGYQAAMQPLPMGTFSRPGSEARLSAGHTAV